MEPHDGVDAAGVVRRKGRPRGAALSSPATAPAPRVLVVIGVVATAQEMRTGMPIRSKRSRRSLTKIARIALQRGLGARAEDDEVQGRVLAWSRVADADAATRHRRRRMALDRPRGNPTVGGREVETRLFRSREPSQSPSSARSGPRPSSRRCAPSARRAPAARRTSAGRAHRPGFGDAILDQVPTC